ncbi:MAG TPA: FAD binding domain-containing protein [Blastocatellia bacterium]|nr:FAD binding domain-containing protein [Blastocatellia bacterium]
MNRFEYVNVASLNDAAALIDGNAARLKAGGVDLLDQMKGQVIAPDRLVNILNVPNANHITLDPKGLRIGPLATLAKVSSHAGIKASFAALADSVGQAANPQIRNMATIAGNICQRPRCWYFRGADFHCLRKGGDHCFAQEGENRYHAIFDNDRCAIVHPSSAATPLMAFHASVKVLGGDKTREIKLEDFFVLPDKDVHHENILQPNEVITEIMVPHPKPGTHSVYLKQAEKETFDWPIADVVAVLTMQGGICKEASIVMGAASPVPHRAKEAEEMLKGKRVTESLARAAAKASLEKATPLADNGYKVLIFDAIIRRAILQAAKTA